MAKKNKNSLIAYFEQKDNIRPIALGVLVLGVIMIWIPISWIAYLLATILIPAGLIGYIVSASRLVSHDELPDQAKRAMQDYDIEYTTSKEFSKEVLRHPAPYETELYVYGEDTKYYKKLKDGRVVSDVYVKTHLFFTNEALVAISRKASLCSLDGLTRAGITDTFKKIPFSSISNAALVENELEAELSDIKKPIKLKQHYFVVDGEQEELLRLPVKDDVAIVAICEEIKRKTK